MEALSKLVCNNDHRLAKEEGRQPRIRLSAASKEAKDLVAAAFLLAVNNDIQLAIAMDGGIPPLVELLVTGSTKAKEIASEVLWILSERDDNKVLIAKNGGIAPLIELLENGSEDATRNAAGALLRLAMNEGNGVAIANQGGVDKLLALMSTGTQVAKDNAAGALELLEANRHEFKVSKEWIVPLENLVDTTYVLILLLILL